MSRALVLAVIVLGYFTVRYFQLRLRVNRLWAADIVLNVYEENTKTNVPAYVGPIPAPDKDGLPIFLSLQGKSESEMSWRFLIASYHPQILEVSAKGFQTERVTIQESGSHEIKVTLKQNE